MGALNVMPMAWALFYEHRFLSGEGVWLLFEEASWLRCPVVWGLRLILVLPQVPWVMAALSVLFLGSVSPSVREGLDQCLSPALITLAKEVLTYNNEVESSFWKQVDSGDSIFCLRQRFCI